MTTRKLKVRMKEHMSDVTKCKDSISGLTEHLRDSGHRTLSEEILDKGTRWFDIRIREGIQVAIRKPQLNKIDSYVICECWAPFL